MDWEDKMYSIVKETESNLAQVRSQLDSSKVRHSSRPKHYSSSDAVSSPNLMASSSFKMPSLKSSYPYNTMFDSTGNQNESSSSPVLLNVLFERIEQQAKTLSSLSHMVKRLEKEKSHQAGLISTLQDQVSSLSERMSEHGVDLETERKLAGFKREIYSHLERMQSQNRLKPNREDICYGDPSNATLARDLHENKRLLQDDCDSLRREIDHLKMRIGKMELDSHATLADARDSKRRLECIDRTVSILSENQRSQSHSIESIVDDREVRNSEMGSLRSELHKLSTKVSQLQSHRDGQSRYRRKQSGISSSTTTSTRVNTKGNPRPLTNALSGPKTHSKKKHDIFLSDSDTSTALLGLSSGSDSEATSVQIDSHSYRVDDNDELSDLSNDSVSSVNSDELLAL